MLQFFFNYYFIRLFNYLIMFMSSNENTNDPLFMRFIIDNDIIRAGDGKKC